jgi:hypothetical protein
MKVEKKVESFYILGHLLELITKIWRFELFFPPPSKFGIFGSFFSRQKKILFVLGNHIFQVKTPVRISVFLSKKLIWVNWRIIAGKNNFTH